MNAAEVILIVTALGSLVGSVALAVWGRRQPKVDEATTDKLRAELKKMNDQSNRYRDFRLVQYDRYFYEQDLPWHQAMARLMQQAKDAGFLPDNAVIPPSPVLPEPPPYGE